MVSGFVQRVLIDDKMIYKSCPVCRKKIRDEPAGYFCEQCDKIYPTMIPTYMFTAKISDLSGSIYVQFLTELGEPLMNGMPAKEFQ